MYLAVVSNMRNIHHHSVDAEFCSLTSRLKNVLIRATCRKLELLPLNFGRLEHADLRSSTRRSRSPWITGRVGTSALMHSAAITVRIFFICRNYSDYPSYVSVGLVQFQEGEAWYQTRRDQWTRSAASELQTGNRFLKTYEYWFGPTARTFVILICSMWRVICKHDAKLASVSHHTALPGPLSPTYYLRA